jgi:hypothetical protein
MTCSARAEPWFSDAEIGSELKARSEIRADLELGLEERSEVKDSGSLGPLGQAENPVKIRSPRESATFCRLPNLISYSGAKLSIWSR